MNLKIFIDFWNARERRERSLLVSALLFLVLILLITFFTKTYSSITIQNRALESAKNDFYYVFEKAENAEIFNQSKQTINQGISIDEFFISQAQLNEISDLNISEENGQAMLTFSQPLIINITKFIQILNAHPSILINSMEIAVLTGTFQIKLYIKII
jgi:type II secretory pathway component PulM